MDSELGRFISEDPLAQDLNLYSYSGNNPISRIDPSGLWYYEVDPDSGEMIATAEEDDTLSGLSSQYYGSTDYINQIATDNEIADADTIQEGQRFVLGDYTKGAGMFHGGALRQSFINGDISYEALKSFSALYKLSNAMQFTGEERKILADIQNYFAAAHTNGEITGEQLVKIRDYYGGWEFVDRNYGVTTASATGDELLVLGGMAAYRLAKIFGPMIWSSPFVQKLITNDTSKTAQTTVLGKWQEIKQYKDSMNMLNINQTVFRVLEFFDKGWEVNRMWLDRCIARGDTFYLGSKAQDYLTGTSYFTKELQYMISQGYKVVGNYLVKF